MKNLKSKFLIFLCVFSCAVIAFTACGSPPRPAAEEEEVSEIISEEKHEDNVREEDNEDIKLPFQSNDTEIKFRDVGEEFTVVSKPFFDLSETILNDLTKSGEITLNEFRNPKIKGIRYFYGRSLQITVQEDVFIDGTDSPSEFLHLETGYSLENFGGLNVNTNYDEAYISYRDFLQTERRAQKYQDYVHIVLPYAEKSAALILEQYEAYKNSEALELKKINYGKQLILSKDSSLSEAYDKIIGNLNGVLSKRGYPLLTNQDLDIAFGGNMQLAEYARWIIIETHISCLNYTFYISFNENGDIPQEYINYFEGTRQWGYMWSDPDVYNPPNEEYAEFFACVEIEKIDLSDICTSYGYDGVGSALYRPDGEDTFLYF